LDKSSHAEDFAGAIVAAPAAGKVHTNFSKNPPFLEPKIEDQVYKMPYFKKHFFCFTNILKS
jgi:hypothetical protein